VTNPVWSHYGGDPAPANLAAVRGIYRILSDTADAATTINKALAGITGQADGDVWSGESADAFRSKLDDLPELVRKVERSYADAAAAVSAFLTSVQRTQADAQALVGSAWSATDQHTATANIDTSTPEAQERVDAAKRAVDSMTAKVEGVRSDYHRAETTLLAALDVAKDEGIPPESMWHHFVRAIEDWSGKIALVLAVIVIVCLVVLVIVFTAGAGLGLLAALALALETLGPLLTALTALQVTHLAAAADRKIQYHDDDAASWTSLGVETALLVVPMGAGKLVNVFGTGGRIAEEGGILASHADDVSSVTRFADDVDAAAGAQSNFMAKGENFANYASRAKPEPGYHDVIAHGDGKTFGSTGTSWADGTNFDHRVLSSLLKNDPAYTGGPVRLLSCYSGAENATAAQNLANKLGVEVLAPTDKLWAYGSGRMTIGATPTANTGVFTSFKPGIPK
jgi:uncharacterized protein YukE